MKSEILKDFLEWTKKFHQKTAVCLKDSASNNEDERSKMLLKYVSKNEKELSSIMASFIHSADEKALNTWIQEFFDKSTINKNDSCSELFDGLDALQIINKVISQHNEIISFYRDLHSEAAVNSTKELLEQLIEMEENHIKQMVQSTNRMSDM